MKSELWNEKFDSFVIEKKCVFMLTQIDIYTGSFSEFSQYYKTV